MRKKSRLRDLCPIGGKQGGKTCAVVGMDQLHTEIGFELVNRAIKEIEGMGHPDSPPKLSGKQINLMISPHPINKRKPKHYTRAENHVPDDAPTANEPAAKESTGGKRTL